MPIAALIPLMVSVAVYVAMAGGAALRFAQLRQQSPSEGPEGEDLTVVVLPRHGADPVQTAQAIRESDKTKMQVEVIVVLPPESEVTAAEAAETSSAMRIVKGKNWEQPIPPAALKAASGSVLLTAEAGATVPNGWLAAMTGPCTPGTPVVIGPLAYRHQDRFFPRLQALVRIGRTAATATLASIGAASFRGPISNRAYHRSAISGPERLGRASPPLSVTMAPEALMTTLPSSSLWDYLRRTGRRLRQSLYASPNLIRGAGVACGLANALLLGTGLVSLLWPTWRQPILLALLAKMGADAALTTPVARHFGQRTLLRSLVPTVLFVALTTPIALLVGTVGASARFSS